MSNYKKLLRWISYPLAVLMALVILYGFGRLIHVSMGSLYHGERAPYLQMATPTSMLIRWQTEQREIGLLRYGLDPENLDMQQSETAASETHAIQLQHLKPATLYYYTVGTKDRVFKGGDDYWFVTPPMPGTASSTRFWVLGDPGLKTPQQTKVRDAAFQWLGKNLRRNKSGQNKAYLDLVLTTGDNAYYSGKNEEFQGNFFQPYEAVLRNIPVWPIYGNHDARRWAFFDIFNFPESAEAGGVASNTEHYYSFDYANIHFVVLDSEESDRSQHGTMAKWLRKDLAAQQQDWLIALFHHPPYSKGSHDSDRSRDSRGRMTDMRENIIPILEQAGVDLVFSGHSHMYERSYLMGCHYGTSDQLQAEMLLSQHKRDYQKRQVRPAPHQGTIYTVLGSSARVDYGPLDHPAMAVSMLEVGSMVVDINGPKLTAYFINGDGQVADTFSIRKGVKQAPVGTCHQELGAEPGM